MPEVYLSPSVRHFNRGFGVYGTEEERMNLLADVVELELVRNGLTTARNNPAYDLVATVADANAQNADVYVALRSAGDTPDRRGATVYYYQPNTSGYRLAENVYKELSAVTPTEDHGLREGAGAYGGLGYYELRHTRPPAIIAEVGYHSNPQDAGFIVKSIYELGVAIAKGILNYFGLPYTPPSPEEEQHLKNEYNNVFF